MQKELRNYKLHWISTRKNPRTKKDWYIKETIGRYRWIIIII